MAIIEVIDTIPLIEFTALGLPRPKGSLRPIGRMGQRVRLIEQVDPKKIWRTQVATFAKQAAQAGGLNESIDCPVRVEMTFIFPRPKKPQFDVPASRKVGDIDKLQRNVFDSLQDAGVLSDDARAVSVCVEKVYATDDREPGVIVTIWAATA